MLREMVETSSSKFTESISSNVDRREIFISKVIESAIREKSCPICLRRIDVDDNKRRTAVLTVCMHVYCIDCIRKWSEVKRNCPLCNAEFDSWFFRIRVSTGKFEKERLPKLEERKEIGFGNRRRERASFPYQRSLSRSRGERHSANRRSRPLPWRRSFGQPRYVPNSERQQQEEIVAERVLRWRASIYTQQLQAIPLPSGNHGEKNTLGSNGMKERVERRVEPWIARELQAILGNLDTSVIVHVASSLYVLSLEEKLKGPTSQPEGGDNFIEPLRRFLHDRTNMFWHELRCFDESSLAMEIYDTVVEYKQVQNGE